MRRRKFIIFPILIAVGVMLFQYFGSEKVTNPITGRSARVALSAEQEETLGLQSFREVLSQLEVVEQGPEYDLVVRVAERLARATGDDARDFKWAVSVVKSPQANAFCLPGGKIAVYTGILPYTKTEDGLAAVMGRGDGPRDGARDRAARLATPASHQPRANGYGRSQFLDGQHGFWRTANDHGRARRGGAIRRAAAIQSRA